MCRGANHCNEQIKIIHDNMVELLGLSTVRVLVERVKWNISEEYDEAHFITYTRDTIDFTSLFNEYEAEVAEKIFEEFIEQLYFILKKLVGKSITSKIIDTGISDKRGVKQNER